MEHIPDRELGVELLNARYDLSPFDSGDEELNDFLEHDALKEQNMRLSKTHLCFYRDRISGFITLAADSIKLDKKRDASQIIDGCDYPTYPCILIARLATDERLHGRGIGSYLLGLAIGFALDGPLGCRFLSVDPKEPSTDSDETPEEFYIKQGFGRWTEKRRMYLNLEILAQQLREGDSPDFWSTKD